MKCFRSIFSVFIFCFVTISGLFAKEIKPKVLIYGDNIEAFAAAIQSARSNVPTMWVIPSSSFCSQCEFKVDSENYQQTLVGGLWMDILQEIAGKKLISDSLFIATQFDLEPQLIRNAMDRIMNTQLNLTILKDVKVNSIINKKKNIDILLSNKKKLNVISLVDATEQSDLIRLAKVDIQLNKSGDGTFKDLGKDMLRTLVAIGEDDPELYGFTVKSVLAKSFDNLFYTSDAGNPWVVNSSISTKLNLGQAVGASVAYCAFFKTTADQIDVRKLQTELMSFGSRVLPFTDVSIEDPNFKALQKIFLVGLLPWDNSQVPFKFNAVDSVSVESVRPVVQQLYSRAQLWFVDNKAEYFTVKDAIELMKVVAFRADELDKEVEKAWKKRFKFVREFDLDQTINRYEFAVLMDAYAEPFAKSVNLEGKILR